MPPIRPPSPTIKLVIGGLNAKPKNQGKNKTPGKIENSSKTKKKNATPNISDGNTPIIFGHHTVPPVAPPKLRITHLADPFVPIPQSYDSYEDDFQDMVDVRKSSGRESMSQEQVMEMLKMHERLLYTILATIGIPLVIILIFYIEVCFCCCCSHHHSIIFLSFLFCQPVAYLFHFFVFVWLCLSRFVGLLIYFVVCFSADQFV